MLFKLGILEIKLCQLCQLIKDLIIDINWRKDVCIFYINMCYAGGPVFGGFERIFLALFWRLGYQFLRVDGFPSCTKVHVVV